MKRLLLSAYLLAHRQFRFSRVETNGFVLLLLLLGLILLAPSLLLKALPEYNPAPDQHQLEKFAAELQANRAPARQYPARYARTRPVYGRRAAVPQVALAPFNPNTLSATDWEARGVPHYVAARLVRYGAAIGGFRAKVQVQKAYGLEPALYARLAPYIMLPEELPARVKPEWGSKEKASQPAGGFAGHQASGKHFKRKPTHLLPFDLNTADTAQLQQIRGIGQKTALRLVAYRERLGGFVQSSQLTEVFSFAPDLVDSLHKYSFVRAGYVPERLAINQASFEELKAHPYVGARLARVLVSYRAQHGPFQQADDLRQIRILEAATLEKLRPYLDFKMP
ncbi:hypothetical protein HER32_07045 [Hymenobacter sp. BT18]|uniref:ComEA family DNA-binding protein n=1 Tax=Hymenobacter sp. BT18 TaxID=2835648 RepID=UPI00143E7E29|nr:helix-hairpin-helix domain-containing protein [Hymenobacter sp. BT18]QIX60950.1 hypothetical protein HER32_07045 [Hymenobacter sp. BT18]